MQDANQFVKDVEKSLRRTRLIHSQANLTDEEKYSFCVLLYLRAALECDLLNIPYIQSRWRRYVLSLKEIDVKAYFEDWKTVEAQYMTSYHDGIELSPSFKRSVVPLVKYKGTVTMFPIETCGIRMARQWIVFDSRYQIGSVDRTDDLISEYVADENLLRTFEYDVSREVTIMTKWFEGFTGSGFLPKHGPGATTRTSRREPKIEKWHNFEFDKEIVSLCQLYNWPMRSIFPHSTNRRYLRSYSPARFTSSRDWRYCDIVFVPKSATTNRVISKEPPSLQFMQQGCARAIVDHLRKVPTWRVNLSRQDLSRDLALLGSVDGSYATIDCSKASDFVTMTLLRNLFKDIPEVLQMLESTRSNFARLPNGELQPLEKFAPMGSALAFPIECTVFACICESCIREMTGRPSRRDDYRVYGDDIIVRTRFAEAVVERLQQLHFIVNVSKSFYHPDSRFREACGIEAYCGQDITPLRISRMMKTLPAMCHGALFRSSNDDPRTFVSWTDFANRLMLRGFLLTRRLFLSLIKSDKNYKTLVRQDITDYRRGIPSPMPVLVVPDGTATQWQCKSRYNVTLYRTEIYASVARNRKRLVSDADDSMELFQWFIDRANRDADESLEEIPLDIRRIPDIQVVRQWVPV